MTKDNTKKLYWLWPDSKMPLQKDEKEETGNYGQIDKGIKFSKENKKAQDQEELLTIPIDYEQEEVELEDEKESEETDLADKPAVEESIEDISELHPALDKRDLMEEGIELHAAALKGDREAIRMAFDFFSNAHNDYPEDNLIAAYYADCLALTGWKSAMPNIMFRNIIKATKILDELVNSDPDNIQIRFIRAYQAFRLNEGFLKRTATAISDFEFLIQRYEEGDKLLSQEIYWKILYDMGCAYKRLGMEEDAKNTWFKLLSITLNPKYQELVNQQL